MKQTILNNKILFTILVGTILITLISLGYSFLQNTIISKQAETLNCAISPISTNLTDRLVTLTMNNCTGVQSFQVSESPDFRMKNGPSIVVNDVATDGSSAQVTVSYQNGSNDIFSNNTIDYALTPEIKTVKALAVLFTFVDENGQTTEVQPYETIQWFNNLIFGTDPISYDGYYTKNSIKDHIYQSTLGRIKLSGSTYPKIVKLPLEKFRKLSSVGSISVRSAIFEAINLDDPTYLPKNSFDYYFFSGSSIGAVSQLGYLADGNSLWLPSPLDQATTKLTQLNNEIRTVTDSSIILTKYNIRSVEGVWLASDNNRTGTNYFTGASIQEDNKNNLNYIKLSTTLPANTKVMVRYYPFTKNLRAKSSQISEVMSSNWLNFYLHENYHIISAVQNFSNPKSLYRGIGDPYRSPIIMPALDTMSHGNTYSNVPNTSLVWMTSPLLNAVTKQMLGFVTPLTLKYSDSPHTYRIYQSEFTDISNVQNRPTILKIPLKKEGDISYTTKLIGNYYDDTDLTNLSSQRSDQLYGQEYIIVELRNKNQFPLKQYNFDEGLTSSGPIFYRVISNNSTFKQVAHWANNEVIETIDSTPPFLSGFSNNTSSPVAFKKGNVLTVQDNWQQKTKTASTHTFKYLLSEGNGTKPLYVRYVSDSGTILGTQTILLNLNTTNSSNTRLPQITSYSEYSRTSDRIFSIGFNAVNGVSSIHSCWDKEACTIENDYILITSGTETNIYSTNKISDNLKHTQKIILYDNANYSDSISITYLGGNPVISSPEELKAKITNTTNVNLSWSSPLVGSPTSYNIYRNGILLGNSTTTSYNDLTSTFNGKYTYEVKSVINNIISESTSTYVTLPIALPLIKLDATSLTFNSTLSGTTPNYQNITLSNTGNTNLTWTVANFTASWCKVAAGGLSNPLAAGSNTKLFITVDTPTVVAKTSTCTFDIVRSDQPEIYQRVSVKYNIN